MRPSFLALVALGLCSACEKPTDAPTAASKGASAVPDPPRPSPQSRASAVVGKLHPACAAMTMHESDPLMRWGGAFAVHRGGTVLVIPHESRKAAEAWIDEHRLRGTEMTACSLAIVWWTPGVDEAKAFVDSVPKVVGIIEAEHFAPIDEDSAAALCKSGRLAAVHCRDLATRR